jgi:hypothetical protein
MSGGSCKKIQCDNCETIVTGWSRRILEHHVKCKSAPVPLKQWALEELAKMEDRLREKGAVKDVESMFDDIKEEDTQTKLMGTDKDKKAVDHSSYRRGHCACWGGASSFQKPGCFTHSPTGTQTTACDDSVVFERKGGHRPADSREHQTI